MGRLPSSARGPGGDLGVEVGERLLGRQQQRIAVGEGHRRPLRRGAAGQPRAVSAYTSRTGSPSTLLNHSCASSSASAASNAGPRNSVTGVRPAPTGTGTSRSGMPGRSVALTRRPPAGPTRGRSTGAPAASWLLAHGHRLARVVDQHPAPVADQAPRLDDGGLRGTRRGTTSPGSGQLGEAQGHPPLSRREGGGEKCRRQRRSESGSSASTVRPGTDDQGGQHPDHPLGGGLHVEVGAHQSALLGRPEVLDPEVHQPGTSSWT